MKMSHYHFDFKIFIENYKTEKNEVSKQKKDGGKLK